MSTTLDREYMAREAADNPRYEHWNEWPVYWSSIWVGALASLVAVILLGLMGIAFGAHQIGVEHRIVDLHKVSLVSIICGVVSAFFAGALGGWITGEIAGIRRAETGMYHGAVAWMVATPLLIILAAVGAGSYLGGWYGGLAGSPSWAGQAEAPYEKPELMANATAAERAQYTSDLVDYRAKMQKWHDETPLAARNAAIMGASSLLIGLVGSAIGGWFASGQTLSLARTASRKAAAKSR